MKICDRCRRTDRKVNVHQITIWRTQRDLCTDCEKVLEKIFFDFVEARGMPEEKP